MTNIPVDSADAKDRADHEPLRGHALATAILTAARAQNTGRGRSSAPSNVSGEDACARGERDSGPIPDSPAVSSQVSAAPADSESAGAVEAKASALLTAGRVKSGLLIVDVEGDTGPHTVTLKDDRWSCDCPAGVHRRRCSHLQAVQLIAPPPAMRAGQQR
jgi:hypothetical protein